LRRAWPAPRHLQTAQVVAGGARGGRQASPTPPRAKPARVGGPVNQLNHAYAVCKGVARSAAKNFYYGFLGLPSEKRNALCAVNSFMRHAYVIADDPILGSQEKREKLEAWLQAANAVFTGQATDDPVLLALGDAQRRFKIPPPLFEKLVQGTSMDLDIPSGGA